MIIIFMIMIFSHAMLIFQYDIIRWDVYDVFNFKSFHEILRYLLTSNFEVLALNSGYASAANIYLLKVQNVNTI